MHNQPHTVHTANARWWRAVPPAADSGVCLFHICKVFVWLNIIHCAILYNWNNNMFVKLGGTIALLSYSCYHGKHINNINNRNHGKSSKHRKKNDHSNTCTVLSNVNTECQDSQNVQQLFAIQYRLQPHAIQYGLQLCAIQYGLQLCAIQCRLQLCEIQ